MKKLTFKKGEKFAYIIPWVNGEEIENTRTFNKTTYIYAVTDNSITKNKVKKVFGRRCLYKFLGYNKEDKSIRYYYLEQ